MFFRAERADLLAGITKAMRASTTKGEPDLGCVLIKVMEDGVRFTGTNFDITIETALIPIIPSSDIEVGGVLVYAKVLAGIIKSMPPGEVQIASQRHDVVISSGNVKMLIPGEVPMGFPKFQAEAIIGNVTMDCDKLQQLFTQVKHCASKNPEKLAFTGALLNVSAERIEMCTCDGFRAALSRCTVERYSFKGEGFSVIIPMYAIAEAVKFLPKKGGQFTLTTDGNQAWIDHNGAKFTTRLIKSEFVKYTESFVKTDKRKVILNRGELIASIMRALLLRMEGHRGLPVMLKVEKEYIQIKATSDRGELNDEVAVASEAEGLIIYFNPIYLMEALKSMGSEQIEMHFGTPINPCIIHPLGENEHSQVLVPMRPPA